MQPDFWDEQPENTSIALRLCLYIGFCVNRWEYFCWCIEMVDGKKVPDGNCLGQIVIFSLWCIKNIKATKTNDFFDMDRFL